MRQIALSCTVPAGSSCRVSCNHVFLCPTRHWEFSRGLEGVFHAGWCSSKVLKYCWRFLFETHPSFCLVFVLRAPLLTCPFFLSSFLLPDLYHSNVGLVGWNSGGNSTDAAARTGTEGDETAVLSCQGRRHRNASSSSSSSSNTRGIWLSEGRITRLANLTVSGKRERER